MNPRKAQIVVKYWRWQFSRPGFQKERQKIATNATRIARQIGVYPSDFELFLRFVGQKVWFAIDEYEYQKFGPIALAFFAHRLQPVTIGNSLRRWTISFARAISESDSDCLELVRGILTEKIHAHLS